MRVSTADQCLDLQADALRLAGCGRVFDDRTSGRSRKRPGLEAALATVGPGDRLVVWRLDRLGRNFRHLVDIADELRERGANLISLQEGIDTSSNVGEIVFRLMSVFSDFERNVIVERTVAGLEAAKARGQRLGRHPKLSAPQLVAARKQIASGHTVDMVASHFGIGRSTMYRRLRDNPRPERERECTT